MSHHCRDYALTAQARAGAGLPAIEPGMPTPAGTGLTRRSFVARAVGLAMSVYGIGKLGLFEEGIAAAAAGPQPPILVTVFLHEKRVEGARGFVVDDTFRGQTNDNKAIFEDFSSTRAVYLKPDGTPHAW